jgi:hypothetical protein
VNQIVDLQATSDLYFKWQSYFWVQSTNTGADLHSLCNSLPMLGGYGIGGNLQRSYTGIGGHNIIYFQLDFYAIDGWGVLNTDKVTISFDTVNFPLSTLVQYSKTQDLCGDSNQFDLGLFTIKGKALHSASTLTLNFRTRQSINRK